MDQGTQTVGRNAGKHLRLSNPRRETSGLCRDNKRQGDSALLAQGELSSGLTALDLRCELGQVT